MKEPVEIKAYKCPECGVAFMTDDMCCKHIENEHGYKGGPKPKHCTKCGCEIPAKSYCTVCESCREKARYNACQKMTIEEYEKAYPDCMVVVGQDDYYSSVEEALKSAWGDEEAIPHYIYGTTPTHHEIDIDCAMEFALEEAYEGAEFSNVDELRTFVDEWNKKNAPTTYYETKIVIDIPEDIRQEYIRKD